VITSSIAGEGKTTTVSNLAVALAEIGKRVLLVDADLRRPRIADVFQLIEAAGLTDVLTGDVECSDAIQDWGVNRQLCVLTAGSVPPNPAELLESEQMAELMANWQRDYDVVLLDSPPVLPVTDAVILSRMATGTVLVCASGRARRPEVNSALNALSQAESPVLGVVVTMLPERGQYSYSYTPGYYGPGRGGAAAGPIAPSAE
jgi:capsular exopolysaccharide synthesis family protein